MLAYVGLCWPHVDLCWAKRSEKWEHQKNTVTRRIFWWSAAYLGAMLAHRGAMLAYLEGNAGPSWGYVGPSWGYVGPSWSYVGPSWGYVGPSWGLCCPILRLCWPILRPMLAHVDPSGATRAERWEKNWNSKKHSKTRDFLNGGGVYGGRGCSPSLLRRGENCRTAMPRPGGPWPDKGLPPPAADPWTDPDGSLELTECEQGHILMSHRSWPTVSKDISGCLIGTDRRWARTSWCLIGTEWQLKTDEAFGLRLSLPNVAFWTEESWKKPAPNCSLQASKTLPPPHRNTMQLKDGRGLRPAAASA